MLIQAIKTAVIAEPLIDGREVTVGAIGHGEGAIVGGVETVTQSGEPIGDRVLDLAAKRKGGFAKIKADLSDPVLQPLVAAVRQVMAFLHPLDYATFDFRLDTTGQAYLIDVNADATLHSGRSLAHIARLNGLSYTQAIARILETTQQRWKKS